MGEFIAAAIRLYTLVLVIRMIFSWVPPQHRQNEFYRFLYRITEPVLAPFRRILPPMGGIDFSPILLFIILSLIARLFH